MENLTTLEHVELSEDEADRCREIMLAGNPVFRKWAALLNMPGTVFRQAFFKGSIPQIPQPDIDLMMAVRGIESKMIFGWVKMIIQVARHQLRRSRGYCGDLEDLILEGTIARREAVYSYSDPGVQFKTLAQRIVTNEIRKELAANKDFSGLNSAGYPLVARCVEASRDVGFVADPWDSAVIAHAGLEGTNAERAQAMMTEFGRFDPDSGSIYNVEDRKDGRPDLDHERELFWSAVEKANLTKMERMLLEGSIWEGRGYCSEVERTGQFKNRRGEPVSRMYLYKVLASARAKVERRLGRKLIEAA